MEPAMGGAPVPVERRAKRRFRFSDNLDNVFLKAVLLHRAHIAARGCTLSSFEAVASSFNGRPTFKSPGNAESVSDRETEDVDQIYEDEGTANTSKSVTSKTLYDRFKKLLKDFRKSDRISISRSGVEKEYDEKSSLLCDICAQVDDENEKLAGEKIVKTRAELALTTAGAEVRSKAMKQRSSEIEKLGSLEGNSAETPITKKIRKRMHSVGTGDELGDNISQLFPMRVDRQSRERDLEKLRLALEEKKFEQELKNREEDKEESKSRREEEKAEKKALLELIGLMAKHLSI
jgi:hypothetical protein